MLGSRIAGIDIFRVVDKIIAPIYSIALLTSSRPFAFTLHDLQEKHFPENFSWSSRVWRHLTNRLLTARASRIICESNYVKDDIIRFFTVPESKIAVIPGPPISTLRNPPATESIGAVRRALNLPECYVFYPAQFWPHKNHLRLVEAFARVVESYPDCHLVLTGKQRDEYEKVFERVRELGLTSRVRHIGYVENSMLAALYRGATVAAIPTLFESISIPVYEAFSLGTPVCASNVVALPEQIGDAGLLFDPLSVEDIATKICMLLAAPELRRQLVERGHRRIASVTHDDYALRLCEIIEAMSAQMP
jgi:glycosyltransferase involved in cell wall biosynthesis